MNDKHTPGPWYAEPKTESWFDNHIWTEGGRQFGRHVATVDDDENLELIVAAPAMLAALKKLRSELSPEVNRDPADAANFAAVIVKNVLADLGR